MTLPTAPIPIVGGALEQARVSSVQRNYEREADRLAIQYLRAAGFRPEGYVEMLQLLNAKLGEPPIYEFLRSHPSYDERIELLRASVEAGAMP